MESQDNRFYAQVRRDARSLARLSGQSRRIFEESFPRTLAIVEERLSLQLKAAENRYVVKQRAFLKDLYGRFGETLRAIYSFDLYDQMADEMAWLVSVTSSRGFGVDTAEKLIEAWTMAVHGVIKPPEADELARLLIWIRSLIPRFAENLSVFDEQVPGDIQKYLDLVMNGKRKEGAEFALSWLKFGLSPEKIADDLLLPALRQIGLFWQTNRTSATTEHSATDVTRYVIFRLLDSVPRERALPYKAVLSCVPGDEHEIGVDLMAGVLELKGWSIVLTGRSAPGQDILECVIRVRPDVVFLSMSLTAHLPAAQALILEIRKNVPQTMIILAGAAAVSTQNSIGPWADAVAASIEDGHRLALNMVSRNA
jgi:methanogenic corrinoid protein MtbC1